MGKPISDSEISDIVKAHDLYNGNAHQAAKNLNFSRNTIVKYWGMKGL